MGKKNLSLLYIWETVIVFGISLVSGLVCGVALSKAAELLLIRMLGGDITYDFTVITEVIIDTAAVFGVIFCLLFIKGLVNLWRLNAVTLLKSENIGEKPPRANYLLGIGGIILLAVAYCIALSIKSPLAALSWFFIAVIMVILATYMLFISGSVMLCKILQRNKNYYYKKNHFVSVSSMVYRMKRNGAGLASICILSTMVLVMMLGAGSLYFGAEDSLKARYQKDITASVDFAPFEEKAVYTPEKAENIIYELEKVLENNRVNPQNAEHYVSMGITGMLSDEKLIANPELVNAVNANTLNNVAQIYFVAIEEYNACMGTNEVLKDGEALIHCVRREYGGKTITLSDGTVLKIKKQADAIMGSKDAAMDIIPSVFLVVNDLESVYNSINSEFTDKEYFCRIRLHYGFDTDMSAEAEIKLSEAINERVRELDYTGEGGFYSYNVECREQERGDFYGTYGGIFYLGIIFSVVFLLATVLIIYYKQITEGYEDESRFAVMQKVGMTKKDIRKSINSQMLTVFLMPLATAVLHLSFAFPMVEKLLALFNLRNVPLMITVLGVAVLVFGVFYGIVYKFTSNAYYSIVSEKKQ